MSSGFDLLSVGPWLWLRSSLPTDMELYDVAGELMVVVFPLFRPLTNRVW